MTDPFVPTLGTKTHITDPSQILSYIMRQYASVPKNATKTWVAETISLAHDLSTYGQDTQDNLESAIKKSLTSVLDRIFGGGTSVVVTRTKKDSYYNLLISVSVRYKGSGYTFDKSISVDDTGHLMYDIEKE